MSRPSIRDRKKRNAGNFPFYPILFGLFPVLALTAHNVSQIDLSAAYRSFLLTLAMALVLFGILRLVLRDWTRAAMLSLCLLVLFFSYGQIYTLLKNTMIFGIPIARHRILVVVWAGLAALAAWISTRKTIDFSSATLALNIVIILLLAFPVFQIIQYEGTHYAHRTVAAKTISPNRSSSSHPSSPDIYYIILDAYGRTETLKQVFNYDNSDFLNSLKDRGFYIATCSQSNYGNTQYSLGSSLNLDYLDKLDPDLNNTENLVQANAVRQFMKDQGYTIVSFETGFRFSQWEDADVYYPLQKNISVINNFESVYLDTTPFRILLDYETAQYLAKTATLHNPLSILDYNALHYEQTIHNLDLLKSIPTTVKGPKFVFAHLVIPHPPYVYSPTGSYVPDPPDSGRIPAYRNAVIFIDSAILKVVDQILANSTTPPIIIIQGDHGPLIYQMPYQHMEILNAYYMPGATKSLYLSISPVNTFRVIFNSYFGQNFPLLADVSHYSVNTDQLRKIFTTVPNACTP
jgi:hypothetical protein